MIFIAVKWTIKPEYAERWPELSREFTEATRNEPGNIFFEWSRSLEEENTYQLVEAFQDDAGGDHVNSDHFQKFVAEAPDYVATTPKIVSIQGVDGNGWGEMGEVKPR
ncbi:putative quinol monooxygenase [Actinomycetospora termitidis]|uniref:Quinol monooxygenase n=1 Tax=Actinomycetospora termitidis TaxID=3053470 RepID=A0ABT7M569_9PSEU|nr:putative quinol monooxygenase [Actinomycetospora sp. Odt1-22]MDL5155820.1 putative quinol monooxygenase [Actinomycetospora sp. Odt1-22]